MFYMSYGELRLGRTTEASYWIDKVLKLDPCNLAASSLKTLINDRRKVNSHLMFFFFSQLQETAKLHDWIAGCGSCFDGCCICLVLCFEKKRVKVVKKFAFKFQIGKMLLAKPKNLCPKGRNESASQAAQTNCATRAIIVNTALSNAEQKQTIQQQS